LNSSESNC